MESMPVIKQAQLNENFLEEFKKFPGGERIQACIQCGTCSGSCPSSHQMDLTPRKMLLMIASGMKEEVLKSNSMWYCVSCYACTARCPREIPVADVMHLLKNETLRGDYGKDKLASPVFYQTFNKMVERHGRINEGKLMTIFALKTNPLKMLPLAPLGIKFLVKGRMPFSTPKVSDMDTFRKALARAREGRR